MELTCKRCGYTTNQKGHLIRHLNNKKQCSVLLQDIPCAELIDELGKKYNEKTYDCEFCGKRFNSRSNKSHHKTICKKRHNTDNSDVTLLRQEVKELKETIKQMSTSGSPIIQNQQNAQVINNININLKSFGFETLDHLPQEFLNRCFANKMLTYLIENLHFDAECPQNHNVRIKSKKQELMEIFQDGKWKLKDQDETLTELIQHGYRILRSHGRKNKTEIMEDEELDENDFFEVNQWLEQVYEDEKIQKPIKRDLVIRFLNNRAYLLSR